MLWNKIKQKFKNLSLKKKMLYVMSGLLLLPLICIFGLLYCVASQNMLMKIQYSAEQGYAQTLAYMEDTIVQMIQTTDVIAANSELKKMLNFQNKKNLSYHEQLVLRDYIVNYLKTMEGNESDIQLELYVAEGYRMLLNENYIRPIGEVEDAKWYQNKQNQKIYFAPGVYLEDNRREQYIALIRNLVEDDDYTKINSVLRMNINVEKLENILQNAVSTKKGVTYLINKQNIVVAASNWENFNELGLLDDIPQMFQYNFKVKEQEMTKTDLHGREVYITSDKIRNTDWEMVTIIPKQDMLSDFNWLLCIVLIMLAIFVLLVLVGENFILSWVIRRISFLNESIKKIDKGDTAIYLGGEADDEIGKLYNSYNDMVKRIQQLMDEKYQIGMLLKSTELKALQAQINPHFLYNTLDMVNWLAYGGRNEEIHETVIALSKYYRLVLNRGQDTLLLAEELQHVMYYVKIQNIRFSGKITYQENVEEEIKNIKVPKIILQPLVENAILHGIREKPNKTGTIRVTGFLSGEDIVIKVTDNGVGMDEEKLAHIMNQENYNTQGGYGVRNVHARLQLMFGPKYGLEYTCIEGTGTCVTIRLPADKLKENQE